MLILLPVILMVLTALTLVGLRAVRPNFKYPWLLATGGATLAFASCFLWVARFPIRLDLPAWLPQTGFPYTVSWRGDGITWPYTLALAALAAAVVWTSVVRAENDPNAWAGTLVLTALGILTVTADNPLTLLLTWSVIDLVELVLMLRTAEGESQNAGVVLAFAARVAGTGLVLLAGLVSLSEGGQLDFLRFTPPGAGIYLLIAAGLRLGVFPLHLPYKKENVLRRGVGTTLRLVSAAASLALLAHIPTSGLNSALTPYLLLLAAATALYAGWMWLRASDEIVGRPFWVLALASLAVAESLRGNSTGSIGWGLALILGGSMLFLYSARRRSSLWLIWLGLWALSAFPYSPTAVSWQGGNNLSWIYLVPLLPAQALLAAGYIRHTLHPGETSLESQEKWIKIIYPLGLLFPLCAAILIGLLGWSGAHTLGLWALAIPSVLLTAAFFVLSSRLSGRAQAADLAQRPRFRPLTWLAAAGGWIYRSTAYGLEVLTSTLEGEGGLLWSFLLLVLIISILSTLGH